MIPRPEDVFAQAAGISCSDNRKRFIALNLEAAAKLTAALAQANFNETVKPKEGD